jgi:hypothetical protein
MLIATRPHARRFVLPCVNKTAGQRCVCTSLVGRLQDVANVRNVPGNVPARRYEARRASMRRTLSNQDGLELIAPLPTG